MSLLSYYSRVKNVAPCFLLGSPPSETSYIPEVIICTSHSHHFHVIRRQRPRMSSDARTHSGSRSRILSTCGLVSLWWGTLTPSEWFKNYQWKWTKPYTKSHILHNSIYLKCPEYAIRRDRKLMSDIQRMVERGNGVWLLHGQRWWGLGMMKMFWN